MIRSRLLAKASLGLLFGALVPGPLVAASTGCSASAQGVSFGAYDPFDPDPTDDGVGAIEVNCDTAIPYTVAIDGGVNAAGPGSRRMIGPGGFLIYDLFTDRSFQFVWGDGAGATSTVSGSATRSSFAVYGRIPPKQNVSAGNYADSVVVTISY